MDRLEQGQLQFLGFIGILKESFNIIYSRRRIFSQISVALILPLSFVLLAHIQVSRLLFFHILASNQDTTFDTSSVGGTSAQTYGAFANANANLTSSEWTAFWLFKAAYFTFLVIFSLLSTSAVVYTVACIYTAKEISFKKVVISVVPKVWKRLLITFLWSFAILMAYNVAAAVLIASSVVLLGTTAFGIALDVVLLVLYLTGFVYMALVWRLANVVSVLEEDYGIKAMRRSKELIKGKMGVTAALLVLLVICLVGIQSLFERGVVVAWSTTLSVGVRIGIGMVCLLLLMKVVLFGLVTQTVIYFVCKSYHHENIDKSCLADHLEIIYLGEYVPLKTKDIVQLQLDHFTV